MRFSFRKAWLVAGLAMVATSCSGRMDGPSVPAATVPAPTPVVLAPEPAVAAEATLPAPAAAAATALPTVPAMIATKKATAQIPDPTDSQATAAAPATTEPAPAAVIPEATPTFSSSITLEQQQLLASLPSRGPAPELVNETWLNTEPLRLADLRGKVVLLDMWTFG